MSVDDFVKVQRDFEDARAPKRSHPKGWEPGIDTARQTLTVQACTGEVVGHCFR